MMSSFILLYTFILLQEGDGDGDGDCDGDGDGDDDGDDYVLSCYLAYF